MTITAAPVVHQSRLRRNLPLIVGAVVVIMAALLTFAFTEERSDKAYAPNSSEPRGAMAVANILKESGVRIEYVTTTSQALAAVTPDSTLAIIKGTPLRTEQREALSGVEADIVMVGTHVSSLSPWREAGVAPHDMVRPQCEEPHAVAAGPLMIGGRTVDSTDGCYLTSYGALLASAPRGDHTVTYVADARIIQNSHLAADGNAALAMRLLGQNDHLVWYIPSIEDPFPEDEPLSMPPLYTALALFSVLLGATLWLWQGRRFGPVVVENLPVQVPAAETTRGLANLYQMNQDRSHTLQVLRAGTLLRISKPLGLNRSAAAPEIVHAITQRTNRPPEEINQLLYGPAPVDDEEFLRLSNRLATLEDEVLKHD